MTPSATLAHYQNTNISKNYQHYVNCHYYFGEFLFHVKFKLNS